MIQYGKLQQFTVSLEHTWMTGRGWGIEVDKTLAVYGNEKKPEVYFKESGSTIDYEVYGDSVCALEYEDYHLSEESLALYYPVYYLNGKFKELSSIEINMAEIQKWKGYKKTYDTAMSQQLTFEKYVAGQAANVSYTLPVDNIEFERCLYNDNGYIFLNGKAGGMMEEWVSALFEDDQPLPYYSEIDVCLEMKLEDGEITEYRWLGAHQKKSATDYEKIPSKLSNATIILSDDRADEKKEKQQKKVSLIVYTAEDVHVNGNRVELNGVIQESGEDRTYIVDEDTEIIADTQFFSKYKNGMSGYAWLKKLSSEIDDSNWMDICGVYEMLVTGNHVDVITGLYWWD